MKDKALIVCCETNLNFSPFQKNHFIVGVERGCLDLIAKNINIDLVISDFDQVTKQEINLIKQNSNQFIKLNCQKDFLDGIAALNYLKEKNFKDITMILKPTKRYDMNISILDYVFNYNTKILNDNSLIFKLEAGENILSYEKYNCYSYVSFFSLEENYITVKNLKYETEKRFLKPLDSFAYSNCFDNKKDGIIILKKQAIVLFTK